MRDNKLYGVWDVEGSYEAYTHKFQNGKEIEFAAKSSERGYDDYELLEVRYENNDPLKIEAVRSKKYVDKVIDNIIYDFEGRHIDVKVLNRAIEEYMGVEVKDKGPETAEDLIKKLYVYDELVNEDKAYFVVMNMDGRDYKGAEIICKDKDEMFSVKETKDSIVTGPYPMETGVLDNALIMADNMNRAGCNIDIGKLKKDLGMNSNYKAVKEELLKMDCFKHKEMNSKEWDKYNNMGLAFNGSRVIKSEILTDGRPDYLLKKVGCADLKGRRSWVLEEHKNGKSGIGINAFEFRKNFNIASAKIFIEQYNGMRKNNIKKEKKPEKRKGR